MSILGEKPIFGSKKNRLTSEGHCLVKHGDIINNIYLFSPIHADPHAISPKTTLSIHSNILRLISTDKKVWTDLKQQKTCYPFGNVKVKISLTFQKIGWVCKFWGFRKIIGATKFNKTRLRNHWALFQLQWRWWVLLVIWTIFRKVRRISGLRDTPLSVYRRIRGSTLRIVWRVWSVRSVRSCPGIRR